MSLLLGVDGGGSKTRAIVCTIQGSIVAAGAAASSNPRSVGFDAAFAALDEAVARARTTTDAIAAACFGIAGLDREEDRARLEQWVRGRAFAERSCVVHDSDLVLAAGTTEGWGAGLICGTGSVAFAKARDGRLARAGGWGWLLGDEGSGYAIGSAALRAVTQAADGRGPATDLLAAVLDHWKLDAAVDLPAFVDRARATRAEIAGLARVVLARVDAGDASARAITERAAIDAAALLTSVLAKLGEPDAEVALAGGLLVGHAGYRASICAHAGLDEARTRVVDDPARGAIVLARRLIA